MVAISNQFINIMARSKRIALSVDPEYHELLTNLADYQKKTVTGVKQNCGKRWNIQGLVGNSIYGRKIP